MKAREYAKLQKEFSSLLKPERINRKFSHSGYQSAYKEAVRDCKAKLCTHFHYNNDDVKKENE